MINKKKINKQPEERQSTGLDDSSRAGLVRVERMEESFVLAGMDAENGVGDANHVLGTIAEANGPAGGREEDLRL